MSEPPTLPGDVVLENFHAPDDQHSTWWINTAEMTEAILDSDWLRQHDQELREGIARDIEAVDWGIVGKFIALGCAEIAREVPA